jgi:hypothetical protein
VLAVGGAWAVILTSSAESVSGRSCRPQAAQVELEPSSEHWKRD